MHSKAYKGSSLIAPVTKTLSVSFNYKSRMNSLFQLLALGGNKNWPPSMKVEKLENFQNKKGLMGCKWSSLNAQGT